MGKKVNIDLIIKTADAANSIKDIKSSIDELDDAASGLSLGSEELDRVNEKSQELKDNLSDIGKGLKDAGGDGKKGLGLVSKGFKGVGLAIKAAGIGLVIGLFAALKEVLEKQQPILDLLDTSFTAIGLAISTVTDVLTDAFKANSESNGGFDATIKVVKSLITIGLAPLKLAFNAIKAAVVGAQLIWEKSFFGDGDPVKIKELEQSLSDIKDDVIDIGVGVGKAAGDIVDNVVEAGNEIGGLVTDVVDGISKIDGEAIIANAKRTTELKKNAEISKAINQGLLEDFDRQAELQRQIRDDESKSIEDRQAANELLGDILRKQGVLMQKNADVSVAAAQAELAANNTTENRVKLIEAQNEKLAISAQITGFNSEQLVNETALQKEANEATQTAIDGIIRRSQIERDFNASKIEDDTLRLEKERENLDIEQEIELERLQNIINNTAAGTQAKIDAEQTLFDAQLDFKIRKEEKDIEISENKKQREDAAIDEEKKNAEKSKQILKAKQTAQLDFASAVGGALQGIAALAEEGSEQAKVLALADIAIGTGIGFIKGLNIAQSSAAATGPAGALTFPIFLATQFGAVLSAAARAKAILSSVKGPSGGGGGGSAAPSIPAAPKLTPDTLFSTGGLEGGGTDVVGDDAGINQQPIKAVVLESDISSTQNRLQNFQEQSEIG